MSMLLEGRAWLVMQQIAGLPTYGRAPATGLFLTPESFAGR
jgi:hypothetical protein